MKSHENNAIYCVFERLAHHKSAKFAINSHEKLCLRSKHDFWCLKAPKLWKGYPKVVPTGHLQVTILGPKGGLGVHTVYELILKAHRWSGKCQKWRLWLPPGVQFRYLCVCFLFSNWTILNKCFSGQCIVKYNSRVRWFRPFIFPERVYGVKRILCWCHSQLSMGFEVQHPLVQ